MDREVYVDDMDHPVVVETFTLNESAEALGKTLLTIRKWIKDGIVPPPILKDTVRGYVHFSVGELKLIADCLFEHEQEFDYLYNTHTETINRIWQMVEAYRKSYV